MTRPSAPPVSAIAAAITAIACACVAACSNDADRRAVRAHALFDEIAVDTAPGLSGLAADDTGGLWTVSERGNEVYRITLDPALVPTVQRFAVTGIPPATDLEGIEVLGDDRFAFGTEGKLDGLATVLTAERKGDRIVIRGAIVLDGEELGVVLEANHGAEGVCGDHDLIVAAIEATGEQAGRRWAPIVRVSGGTIVRVDRMWLTTATGKLSGIDCRLEADGRVTGWAIERHFAVTKILRFTLPPPGDTVHAMITPVEALDLGDTLHGRLNLEGIAEMSDGKVVAVVDNQWKVVTGPSVILVFKPGVLAPLPP